jgi:hypothetical protein
VLFDFDGTLAGGAAEVECPSCFDGDNVPAWDTWVAYVVEDVPGRSGARAFDRGYLISWAPPELESGIHQAIAANPEGCIEWATSAGTALTEELRRSGLLL